MRRGLVTYEKILFKLAKLIVVVISLTLSFSESSGIHFASRLFLLVFMQADFGFNDHHQNEIINYMRFARSKRVLSLKTIDSCFEELKDSR